MSGAAPLSTAEPEDEAAAQAVRAARARAAIRLGSLAAFVVAALLAVTLAGGLSADRVHDWASGYGVAGPLVFIVISSALTTVFFPGPLLAGAAGLLFGTALGTPTALASAVLGAVLSLLIGRLWARDAVQEIAGPRLERVQEFVARRGFFSVFYARLTPGLPYTVVNYIFGLTRVPVATFAAATVLGAAPRTWAYVALGGHLGNLGSWQTVVALAIIVAMALAGVVVAARDPELAAALRIRRRR